MKIDAFVTQSNGLAHLAPIWRALPPEIMGDVYLNMNINELGPLARSFGLPIKPGRAPFTNSPLFICGGADLVFSQGRPVIYIEHGAAQRYDADNVCYTGGIGRNAVKLFLVPNQEAAELNLARYPNAHAVAIGDPTIRPEALKRHNAEPVIAFSWHWDCSLVPENRTSWPYWAEAALEIAKKRPVLGHAHPRIQHQILPWWEANRVPNTPLWSDVAARADLYVVDNSSTGTEWMALDRPIIWLNVPFYRRDVRHGGRFWDWCDMAVTIDHPEELPDAIDLALSEPKKIVDRRREMIPQIYVALGDEAAQKGAEAILTTFGLG